MTDKNKPRPVPTKKPGAKKSGPSMKEQLLARRQAEEAAAAKGSSQGSSEGSARKSAPAKASVRAPAAAASGGAPRSGVKAGARPAAAGSRAAAGGAGRRPAGGGRSRGREGAASTDDASDVRRRLRENQKRSPLPFIVVGVLVVGAGAAYVLMPDGDEPGDAGVAAAGPDGAAAADPGTETGAASDTGTGLAGASDPLAASGAGGEAPAAAGGGDPAPAPEAGDASGGDGAPDENEVQSSVKLAVTRDKNDPNNPDLIDVTKLSAFGRPPGMGAEEWASLSEDAGLFLDPDAGAAAGRARRRLLEAGINAWPAIVNEMLVLDVRLPRDNQSGMIAQRTLDEIRGGTTGYAFDWRTPEVSGEPLEPKKQWVNKFTIVKLHDVWRKHLEDPAYFREKIAQGEVKKAMEGAAPPAEFDDLGGDLGDLDDLGG